jgi:hypothetical protein
MVDLFGDDRPSTYGEVELDGVNRGILKARTLAEPRREPESLAGEVGGHRL